MDVLENPIIKIVTSDGEEIEISKSEICGKSEIFSAMLEERENKRIFRMRVTESYESFLNFLGYIGRDDERDRSLCELLDLYKMVKKYQIQKLMDKFKIFPKLINIEFASKAYKYAIKFKDLELQYCCWKLFREFTDDHIKGEEFIHSGKKTVERFVTCPIYTNLSESSLFIGLYRWAKLRVLNNGFLPEIFRIRNEMEPFLCYIRFLVMTRDELEVVFKKGILNESEITEILNYFSKVGIVSVSCNISNNTKKRNIDEYFCLFEYHKLRCFKTEKRSLTPKDDFFCELTVFSKCYLLELHLPICHSNPFPLAVNVKIFRVKDHLVTNLNSTKATCSATGEITIPSYTIVFEGKCRYIIRAYFIPKMNQDNKVTIMRSPNYYHFENESFDNVRNRLYSFVTLFF
ncbi:uncharacterized protein LOC111639647 isoform X2 [Centruroides sculpturatus]|uniref:uncharacterized protein LOC111639647 isoform X2 n=1 Tax=Centruroides sculpturatus TaxID=218467 RepID=UPI000C6CF8E2|nr:uncharacterized protein LOC111639647 isoform X2 [Centruroides sculpturatus]XP_023241328.1 uncharacterized protein LOC111639647 isoform X2 [Centruroides sculpturatus]